MNIYLLEKWRAGVENIGRKANKAQISGKPSAMFPGVAFFAIPVALIFTMWLIVKMGLSLWWALPAYSLIGATIVMIFALLPRN
ncbi:hypothetical protein [Donghicola mangrovi]|uniref:Uncharacterized protein n=1 Tax=Donghicola mangrovi TaxID=2729614 RepID=A0A850QFQ7_9RHOB|nr:hypothetical protein [Donghicola mangrovi]NVO25215.1 hypothetical protein [Donghicola mangrovi]